jgi:hypothetical protein
LKNATPQSNFLFKKIGTQGIFLVDPVQICTDSGIQEEDTYHSWPHVYRENKPIVYLVYYNMNDLQDQNRDNISTFKEKYIENPNLALSPPCMSWNRFVYYNHILPNLCYDVEIDSTKCNPILDYDSSPPTLISQKCSTATSSRCPDCKTYLMTNLELEQPDVNRTRTYDNLDAKQNAFCNKYDTMECQCYKRDTHTAFNSFKNTSYSFPADMSGNAGCWYKPCMDDPTSSLFVPAAFRSGKRNCPSTVCQSLITVINRPENSANLSNLNLRASCDLPTSTSKPVALTTMTPLSDAILQDYKTSLPEPLPPVDTPPPAETTTTETTTTMASWWEQNKVAVIAGVVVAFVVAVLMLMMFLKNKKK